MTTVLDASALLAFVQGEAGADVVEAAMADDAVCGAANWSEITQEVHAADRDWELVKALLERYGLRIEPVTADDGELAARRWRRGEGRSLADSSVGGPLVQTAAVSWTPRSAPSAARWARNQS